MQDIFYHFSSVRLSFVLSLSQVTWRVQNRSIRGNKMDLILAPYFHLSEGVHNAL